MAKTKPMPFSHDYFRSQIEYNPDTGKWTWIARGREVDHINRNKHDDRWGNLRLATRSQNMVNRTRAKKSGLPTGVFRSRSKYQAYTSVKGKAVYLGTFSTAEEAHKAYVNALSERRQFMP